jgi:membrane-associated phospholipid phosphatase
MRPAAIVAFGAALGGLSPGAARAQAPSGPTFDVDVADTALVGVGLWITGLGLGAQARRFDGTPACRTEPGPDGLCDERRIFVLDRPTYGHRWPAAAPASDVLLLGLLAAPLGYAGVRAAADGRLDQPAETFGRSAAVSVEALGAVLVATNVLKLIVRRPRPLTYDAGFTRERRFEGDARLSFPSGHTSLSFGAATVLAVMLSEEVEDDGLKAAGIAAAYGVATVVGYLRVATRRHFLTDVLAGAALGTGLAYAVAAPQLASDDAGSGDGSGGGFTFGWGGTF